MSENGLNPLAPDQWSEELAEILADTRGAPLNIHRLMAHNPALMRAWWPFRNHSVYGGSLSRETAELLILRVAAATGSWYEWAAHVDRAMQLDISIERILAVLQPISATDWPEADASVLMAADELTKTRSLSPETRRRLARHYNNNQIMDLIAIHGMYLILAAMIDTWTLAVDDDILERIGPYTNKDDFLRAAGKMES